MIRMGRRSGCFRKDKTWLTQVFDYLAVLDHQDGIGIICQRVDIVQWVGLPDDDICQLAFFKGAQLVLPNAYFAYEAGFSFTVLESGDSRLLSA